MKKIFLTVLSMVFLFSCASAQKNTRDISGLKERVEAFYRARTAHDFKEAFQYENMSLTREITEKTYMTNVARSAMEYFEAEILSIDMVEGKDEAQVKMRLKFRLIPMQGFEKFNQLQERTIEEKWVYKEGNWYHIIKGVTKEW